MVSQDFINILVWFESRMGEQSVVGDKAQGRLSRGGFCMFVKEFYFNFMLIEYFWLRQGWK